MRTRSAAILLPFLLAACAPPPPPAAPTFTAADVAAIDSVVAAAVEIATSSGDWGAYVQMYYAADAIVLPPNRPAIQGHAAIVDYLRSFPTLTITPTTVDVQGVGDLAYIYGKYHVEMETPAGPAVDDGKYIEIWKRQADGGWKVVYDISNTDLPLVAEGA